MSPVRNCLTCGHEIKGRSDKKFCNDYCRNNYNNQVNAPDKKYMRQVNTALAKNRRILATLLSASGPGTATLRITREDLILLGFHFTYITHLYTTQVGKTYFYCYDYGYLPLDNSWYLVVKKRTA